MKVRIIPTIVFGLTLMAGLTQAAIITVNTADNTDFGVGKTNLVRAIQALQDGDTIQFNIPGNGPHLLITPPMVTGPGGGGGYPEITKNNVTIDGYSQPGAVPNTNPAKSPNNAQIKIVIDSRGGGAHVWDISGFGTGESGMFVVSGNNVTIKGLCFLGKRGDGSDLEPSRYGVALGNRGGHDFHLSGCWMGVAPDGTTVAGFNDGIAGFRHRTPTDVLVNRAVIGVKAGSANPRAEFNVIVDQVIPIIIEGAETRISGNFVGVLPDGLTRVPNPAEGWEGHFELARAPYNIVIGTDGDGVNDADEGNVLSGGLNSLTSFGTGEAAYSHIIEFYGGGPRTNIVIAGNYIGVAVDGTTMLTNGTRLKNGWGNGAQVRIGSNFDGISDDLEGNVIANNHPFPELFFDFFTDVPPDFMGADPGEIISVRGNTLINNNLAPYSYADHFGTRANFLSYAAPYMDTSGSLIPVLATTNTFPKLSGSFPIGINDYTNIVVDVYELDPEGWANGTNFVFPDLINPFTGAYFGFPQGRKYLGSYPVPNTGYFDITVPPNSGVVTVTINYSPDPVGAPNGRVHTGNFSLPGYMIPGGVASVGLTHVVPDVLVWYNVTGGYVTNGPIGNLADQAVNLGNWEPYASVLGDSIFLIEANTFANDGAVVNQNNIVALQPAAGGPAKISYSFSTDAGVQFKGQVNLSRQNGNPGRVAGDKRVGAVNYITAAEASLGQLTEFRSDSRWNNNPIYQANNRYVVAQPFSLNTTTLEPTPLAKAWDFVYGPLVKAEPPFTQPEVSRTGGTVAALDNGNFVIVIHDKTAYSDPAANVTTFAIITPTGAIVKANTLVDPRDIWDNVAAFKGGFVVRCHETLYFYDNAGTLQGSVDNNTSAGLSLDTGRGDGIRTASDIRSHYVYVAGRSPNAASGGVWVAAWDARTREFLGKVQVDDQAEGFANDRVSVAVDALDRVCVAWVHRPSLDFQNQVAARVFRFDGRNFTPLTHSFFPFVNHDPDGFLGPNGDGITTVTPTVAMTTRQICIAAKGVLNNLNNPTVGGNTAAETTVYTVISHPAPVSAQGPTLSIIKSGNQVVVSWDPSEGSFTVQTRASLTSGSWVNATAGNVPPPVNLPIGPANQFIRLVR